MMTTEAYQAPTLSLVGKLEDITLGTKSGNNLDQAFPTGTPGPNLTFS